MPCNWKNWETFKRRKAIRVDIRRARLFLLFDSRDLLFRLLPVCRACRQRRLSSLSESSLIAIMEAAGKMFRHARVGWYIGNDNPLVCLLYSIAGPWRTIYDGWNRPRANQQHNHLAADV